MRILRWCDKKAYISEKDWNQMLLRFNQTEAVEISDGFEIKVACPLCKRYGICGDGCPIRKVWGQFSCLNMVGDQIGSEHHLSFGIDVVSWDTQHDTEAREELDTLYALLSSFPKTKRRVKR